MSDKMNFGVILKISERSYTREYEKEEDAKSACVRLNKDVHYAWANKKLFYYLNSDSDNELPVYINPRVVVSITVFKSGEISKPLTDAQARQIGNQVFG